MIMAMAMAQTCYASSLNKGPILDVLRPRIDILRTTASTTSADATEGRLKVLEIASGTGEHAAYFASELSGLLYQPTEPTEDMHGSIIAWSRDMGVLAPPPLLTSANAGDTRVDAGKSVVLPPITLDVLTFFDVDGSASALSSVGFGPCTADVMICINMIHISPWACTDALFAIAHHCLTANGLLLTYGPYRVDGQMVESNQRFDESLRGRNSEWGIRDKEAVEDVARGHGLVLAETCQMPSNNLCLFFRKQ